MIIGLTGAAGSGKSTVAEMVSQSYGFNRHRFAGPLKDMMRALYRSAGYDDGAIEARIEGDLKEVPDMILGGKTPRQAMQTLGTEWRDLVDRELWSRIWRTKARSVDCIAEDCRFEHEYRDIKRLGGFVVHVRRPMQENQTGHASEKGLPDNCPVDWVIENTGDMEHLRLATGAMMAAMVEHSLECSTNPTQTTA